MAITYVNNLGLSEMATGDNSGTWGNVTNTNLELIGQALGHGTRVIADASQDNITMSDGTADDDRALYLKLTGGGQACTVTLRPATMSKVWIMENGTAAALTFTQGSGANVTIPAGDTKVIACTGGAGTAQIVYDVFASLSVVDLKVQDDLTVTDDVAIGGLATVGGTLGVTGVVTASDDVKLAHDGAVLGFGAGNDVTLTHVHDTGLLLNSTMALQFNDASQFINAPSATVLDITATDEIELNATAIDLNGTLDVSGVLTANAGVVVDNFTLDGTTLALSSGDMTLDIAGELIIDTDSQGVGNGVLFSDDGNIYGNIFRNDSNLNIKSVAQDKDIVFLGNDNGADITALTLDMSDAGSAYFNNEIYAPNKIIHTGDTNTYMQFHGADSWRVVTAGGERMNIIGTSVVFNDDAADQDFRVESDDNANMLFVDGGNDVVNIGGTTAITTAALTVGKTAVGSNTALRIDYNDDSTAPSSVLELSKEGTIFGRFGGASTTVSGAASTAVVVQSQANLYFDATGSFIFNEVGDDVDFRVESDGSANAIFVHGGSNFVSLGKNNDNTTLQGASYSNIGGGHFYLAVTNENTDTNQSCMYVNRQNADGLLIEFRQQNIAEGSISVSGSTVTYTGFSGRHESSGIPANTAIGTVVSTIDELDVYPDTQYNPSISSDVAHLKAGQARADHAKVEVSNSTGDACVYGVVSEFDGDGKLIVTSVGIGSVRVTGACSKGDLLESNGDGTAKVQSDDIVRSKTLGKVTIGNSNTGVKLVACVMYCG